MWIYAYIAILESFVSVIHSTFQQTELTSPVENKPIAWLCVHPLLPALALTFFLHHHSLLLDNASVQLIWNSWSKPRSLVIGKQHVSATLYVVGVTMQSLFTTFQHPHSLFMMCSWHLACDVSSQALLLLSYNVERLGVEWPGVKANLVVFWANWILYIIIL